MDTFINFLKINTHHLFAVFVGFAFLWGVSTPVHLIPSNADIVPDLYVAMFVSIGLLTVIPFVSIKNINLLSYGWVYLFLLVLIQPLINQIFYPDLLIFPLASLFLTLITSIIAYNFDVYQKKLIVNIIICFILLAAFLNVVAMLAQRFDWLFMIEYFVLDDGAEQRPVGNIGQPNQAAYLYSMAVACLIYLADTVTKKKNIIAYYCLAFIYAVGTALCASRMGLVLLISALLGYSIFYQTSLKKSLPRTAIISLMCVLGYFLGSYILKTNTVFNDTIISRITSDRVDLRYYQLQQSWIVFSDNVLSGVGWNNFAHAGVVYAEQLPWFAYGTHSHMFISNIASELGVLGLLCLIPLLVVLIKNIRFNLPAYKAVSLVIVGLTLLYSLTEFPLWFFKYLVIFSLFLSILDDKQYHMTFNIKPLCFVMLPVIFISSIFYQLKYKEYAIVANIFKDEQFSFEQKQYAYQQLPSIFGFSHYKEMLLYILMPVSSDQIDKKIKTGYQVLSIFPAYVFIVKQGKLELLNGQLKKASSLNKAACMMNFSQNCNKLINEYEVLSQEKPDVFDKAYKELLKFKTTQN